MAEFGVYTVFRSFDPTPIQIFRLSGALAATFLVLAFSFPAFSGTCLRGVNIAGAEFGGYEGAHGKRYIYPSDGTLNWAASKGMTAIRLPFRWERLQTRLLAPLDEAELERLTDTVDRANALGLSVILDPHNYGGYRDVKFGKDDVTPAVFADFWSRLAPVFAGNAKVSYLLMNEPADLAARTWFEAAQAGIDAIRQAGADNLILVPGTIWTGASHWFEDQDGGSNAEVFADISDPLNNFVFDFHQYMDKDYSGTHDTCPRVADAILALEGVSGWLRQHGFKGFVGEFGGTQSPDCLVGLAEMAGYLNDQGDIWVGWTAWAAGDWWGQYPLSLQPRNGVDALQLSVLERFFRNEDGSLAQCSSLR